MKILFLSQGRKIEDHPGWQDALVKLKEEKFIKDFENIPYLGFAGEYGWDKFYEKVISLCEEKEFDVIYFHYFHNKTTQMPNKCINKIRKLNKAPIIITSSGDGFSDNWMKHDYPNDFKVISCLADITFSTQMGKAANKMMNWGVKNLVYTPHSMCQVRFNSGKIDYNSHNFDFDVVFVGNNNGRRLFNPVSKHWWGAKNREKLVNALYKRFGERFGLFGNGWDLPCAQGPTPFNEQQNTFRRGRINVGGNPYSYSDYYASNRPFFAVASGVPTVELSVPRLDNVLRNNEHVYFCDDIDSLINKCEELLNYEDKTELYRKAEKAAEYISEKHTQYHRMKFKIETVNRFIANGNKLDVKFPFFLPEVDLKKEYKFAAKTRVVK